ncbi:hypothetical protein HPP92_004391 [Vanilla planifolia]|uniref:Uncharacterized protein n=1 Tax=Vanilla planifolia TaxID=51239 RepID=A0A835RXA3_VANPL|nr:hypothetical protein HPP92_004391 [Vanilla planifolia]
MYPAYAELRDWKLRMKKAGLNPSTPLPIQLRRTLAPAAVRSLHELSMACRNEKRKPQTTPEEAQILDASKNGLIRTGSASAMRREEKRDVELPRSCSSYQGSKELSRMVATRNEEEARRGKAANKGILSKTITGFRRSTAKATGWMG